MFVGLHAMRVFSPCHYAQCLMRPFSNMHMMLFFLFFLSCSTATHLGGDVGSNQLDIGAVGGAGSVAHLPQKLVLRAKGEVRGSTIDVAQSKAAVKRLGSSCGI